MHSLIDNRYEVREVLGQGGMGIVYKAYDDQRKGFVALKTMKDAADPAALELFTQEWRTLANISHPNIVDVLNSGEFEEEHQRKPYFVMPLLPGKTLDKVIRETGHDLTIERTVEILYQTCRGLQAAHSAGLTHRDLKPSNLFVLNDDSVKIIDFGMVHLADFRKSVTGIKGTLQYMAPEQLEMKEVTPATDIFSLAVVAYEALTGRKPFDRPNDGAIAEAIRNEFPPPASELNARVSKTLAQVVAKGMAKSPWNRFASARDFGDHIQKSLKGESIELFDSSRIQPRVERARRALEEGDFEYAFEILTELQSEGHIDSKITVLLEDVKHATRTKVIKQLLDSARTRLAEEEYPLAWQKVQEALQRDPGNSEALALQAEIDTRRGDQQTEKWRRLVYQHLHNHAFAQARQAIEEIRKVRPRDFEITTLISDVDRREKEFRRVCEEKERHFESAMRAYGSGEISTALSKLEKILELDTRTPALVAPERDQVYRETYNKFRSEWEDVQRGVAEIERAIGTGNLSKAAELADQQSSKYPNDFNLQALKLKVDDLLRQEKSAYIAEVGRRVDVEPDLDRAVQLLEEALGRYPREAHFQELASSVQKRRDLVNSIAVKARQYDEQNLAIEALGQWNTLRSIHPRYPGLDFEIEQVQRRIEQHRREEAKLSWVDQIDRLLHSGEHERAHELATKALADFPGDAELHSLERLALEGRDRRSQALTLMDRAEALCSGDQFEDAIGLLKRATELDPSNPNIRSVLADALASRARVVLATDWRTAEKLVQEALEIDSAHVPAKSLRPSVSVAARLEFVDNCLAEARQLQAGGDLQGALAKVQEGLASYANDARLSQLQNTLRSAIIEQNQLRRQRDLEELRRLSRDVRQARDQTSLTALLERSELISQRYPEDQDFSVVLSRIRTGTGDDIAEREKSTPAERPSAAASGSTAAAAATALARETKRPSLIDQARARLSAIPNQIRSSEVWNSLHRGFTGFRTASAPLITRTFWEKTFTSASVRYKSTGLGRLPVPHQAGAAIAFVLLLAIAVLTVRSPNTERVVAKTPLTPVTLALNVEGATVVFAGQTLHGKTLNIAPGSYYVSASRAGYKTIARRIEVGREPVEVDLTLVPEAHVLRISTDIQAGRVMLDGSEVGMLQDGNFSYDVSATGPHKLEVFQGKTQLFAGEFETATGEAARFTAPLYSRELPVAVVSSFGKRVLAYSSVADMKASLKDGTPQAVPREGLELTATPGGNEILFSDGRNSLTVPVEVSNAPVLIIRAGTAIRGTMIVEVNVEDAVVMINGVKRQRPITGGRWTTQLEPADYRIRVMRDGYEEAPEQKVTVTAGKSIAVPFNLKPVVTDAFLRIEGGTPDASVSIDGKESGKLDGAGSAGPFAVAPDAEHLIRLQKPNYEVLEIRRKASVRETATVSGAQARLKPYGTLVFSVDPPQAQVTLQRQGEPARRVTERTLSVREGAYAVTGTADGFQPYQGQAQATSGQTTAIRVTLAKKMEPPRPVEAPVKRVEVKDLFRSANGWSEDNGFWLHEGESGFLKSGAYNYSFDVLRIKKGFGRRDRPHWRIYQSDDEYLDAELDDTNLSVRKCASGKCGEWEKKPHKAGQKDFYRLELTVGPDKIAEKVGQASFTFPGTNDGRTGFIGKFGLRLIN